MGNNRGHDARLHTQGQKHQGNTACTMEVDALARWTTNTSDGMKGTMSTDNAHLKLWLHVEDGCTLAAAEPLVEIAGVEKGQRYKFMLLEVQVWRMSA